MEGFNEQRAQRTAAEAVAADRCIYYDRVIQANHIHEPQTLVGLKAQALVVPPRRAGEGVLAGGRHPHDSSEEKRLKTGVDPFEDMPPLETMAIVPAIVEKPFGLGAPVEPASQEEQLEDEVEMMPQAEDDAMQGDERSVIEISSETESDPGLE